MSSQYSRIDGCRACGCTELKTFLDLGALPLSDGFTADEQASDQADRYPLEVAFCTECTMVQILHTVAPEALFDEDYPYFSSFTDSLLAHAKDNVEARIKERELNGNSFVIELASNDGYLLRNYKDANIPHLGIDPAPGPVASAKAAGIESICAFFGLSLAQELASQGRTADVIHANNVLAHVADTNGFVAGIAKLLKPQGVAVIEAPYVRDLIDHGEFDTIYHEHLCYFSVTALHSLFARHDLHLNRVERLAIHGGSLRLFVEKSDNAQESVLKLLDEERALGIDHFDYYEKFADKVDHIRSRVRSLLVDLKDGNKSIAGYGAAAKGTILLNSAGIGNDLLTFVADRNTHKQGRWVPGVSLEIAAPERIEEEKPDVLLILPWNFKDEIIGQQQAHRARGGKFLVPIPEPVLI